MYFSDIFEIEPKILEDYGAFNISLINDLPLFIDPFLLFNSENIKYKELHKNIIDYLIFLRDQSTNKYIDNGLLKSWYCFHEVKQNWLGFSSEGNNGSGLGLGFAHALNANLKEVFTSFGNEQLTESSHIEKLCLIKSGVGRDNISDFTTNLIKDFLLEYTQEFATNNINKKYLGNVVVPKVAFRYSTQSWIRKEYILPIYNGDYVILTPKDLLTRDNTWISRPDMFSEFYSICEALPDDALRSQLNAYFRELLPKNPKKKDVTYAIDRAISKYPEFIEYYIKHKEETGDDAVSVSGEHVKVTELLFVDQIKHFTKWLIEETQFYKQPRTTYEESLERIKYFKNIIENNDGYKVFYLNSKPVGSEKDLQLIFKLTWFETEFDVNSEVNNGRGPVDFKISKGKKDSTLIEFKLASNSQLKRNLEKQIEIYGKANDTKNLIKVIMYFSEEEYGKVSSILIDLGLSDKENVILIDARADNKPSASKA
jgi:hypothetical protein